jgi:hypothetical protein
MTFDRLPGTSGGDPHFLVVVTDRAAGSKGVAEPETVLDGDAVGDIRKGRRALVGSDDQVRVVAVTTPHAGRRLDLAIDQVVGQIEQAANEGRIAGDSLGLKGFPVSRRWQALADEAALRTERNDDGVLDHLRLDQTEDFRAEVLHAVGPAQTAARDPGTAQVHAFDALAVDEDLVQRCGRGRKGMSLDENLNDR